MNLVQAEFERLASRRFVQLMLALLIAAFTITVATTVAGSHQPTASELSHAQAQVQRELDEDERRLAACRLANHPGASEDERARYPRDCDTIPLDRPQIEDFLNGVFVFERQIRGLIYFLITFLALFGFLVGASYIGADLTSGGMTNLLLWRPQRLTVLGTKLGTLLGAVLGVSALASPLFVGAFWLVAEVRGITGTLDVDFWSFLLPTIVRGWVLTLMVTAIGFTIAVLGRHTAAALGVLAAYGVLWEGGGRIVMEIVDAPRPDLWMLSTYIGAWLLGQVQLTTTAATCQEMYCPPVFYAVNWPTGLLVLSLVVATFVAASFTSFRKRDLV
ncbi:ABC transporter permease subunit [Micromonospora sp. NPDC050417]|uniref:ABC transporter permease subunit n=1 Tax=Micromonospora sp. NPDC050417 TaxID=3364280 RepID=UPI0037A9F489